jgi:hypothetical protein
MASSQLGSASVTVPLPGVGGAALGVRTPSPATGYL